MSELCSAPLASLPEDPRPRLAPKKRGGTAGQSVLRKTITGKPDDGFFAPKERKEHGESLFVCMPWRSLRSFATTLPIKPETLLSSSSSQSRVVQAERKGLFPITQSEFESGSATEQPGPKLSLVETQNDRSDREGAE